MSRWLTFLVVSCDATTPAARTPVQVVEVASAAPPVPVGHPAHAPERAALPPASAHFPEPCRASASEPESPGTTAKTSLPFGALSVRIEHAANSDDDICLAILTDVRGSVIDCKTFADEGCDMEAPVASAGRVTVEGVCITE